MSFARLLAVAALPNFGCDAFRAPAPSLLAAPFQQLQNDTMHAPQLLVSSKEEFLVSSGLSRSGCCGSLGGRLVVLRVPAHRVHGTAGELVSVQISSTSKLAIDCAIPPHVPKIQIGRSCKYSLLARMAIIQSHPGASQRGLEHLHGRFSSV